MNAAGPEAVRLVVWDLDETFWHGTLSEGGHRYRREVHDIVVELADRGIVSSICSKNDMETVRAVLQQEGIWDYFVFPSINWEPKGPRLAKLVEDVQLRAPTIMFIDDNPMNLGEARHYVPGIQTADEHFIETMLDSPLFSGRPDAERKRLKQYQLLQRRKADEAVAASTADGDNTAFLRESGVVVTIEHDFEPHIDRAIELINRTNQLNFTKRRLSEDMDVARAELRELLSSYAVQAGIVHVKDRYGDYGYCGLYVVHTGLRRPSLKHFCFSCRILNMGVEIWLYQLLGRPHLRVRGEVLTDVLDETRAVDWVSVGQPDQVVTVHDQARSFDYVYARGGCDLHALAHYFNVAAGAIHGEYNTVEDGVLLPLNHSVFAEHALTGLDQPTIQAFGELGYRPEHFRSFLNEVPQAGAALWILSFWAESANALYTHDASGKKIPISVRGFKGRMKDIGEVDPSKLNADASLIAYVKQHFSFSDMIEEDHFKHNVRMILGRRTKNTRVFILLTTAKHLNRRNLTVVNKRKHSINDWTRAVADEFDNVDLLDMSDFATAEELTTNPNHFDRMVYFKVFQEIMRRVGEPAAMNAA